VSILVRVSNIHKKPEMSLFVDPWSMVAEGKALLLNGAHYGLKFADKAPWHIDLGKFSTRASSSSLPRKHQKKKQDGRAEVWNWVQRLFEGRGWKGQTQISLESAMRYTYKPLGFRRIRLLVLAPGKGDDPLRGRVTEVSLDSPGAYTALSYRWETKTKSSGLQTVEEGSFIGLTASLRMALHTLRDESHEQTLWVDAICINQDDEGGEKKVQIRLMGDIF